MPRDAFVLKMQRELCHPKWLSRNGPLDWKYVNSVLQHRSQVEEIPWERLWLWFRVDGKARRLGLWRHRCPLITEINMAEYGYGWSTSSKEARSGFAILFMDGFFSLFAAWTIFRHIYFCHERTTTMTSETSENTICVRFYFTLCYLMLTKRDTKIRHQTGW